MIRLVATDLDGTLLEKDGTLPEGTHEVVRAILEKGIHFAAASGRQYGNLHRLFWPVAAGMDFICENGAICAVNGQITETIPMDPADVQEVIADLRSFGMELHISGKYTSYMLDENRVYTDAIVYGLRNTVTIVSCLEEINEPIVKISGWHPVGVQEAAPILVEKWSNRLTATVSGREWFDFSVANKGMGIEMLMRQLGLQKEEVVAFGDNFNDESMLDRVGHPYIMAHAAPELHKPNYSVCEKVLPVLRAIANGEITG